MGAAISAVVDTRIDNLIDRGNKLFADKAPLDSLRQEIAEHFYPERASFTRTTYLGEDFASGLMSSYPVLMRRELGDAFSSYLRPSEIAWFEVTVDDDDRLDRASKTWLERATRTMRRAMYDRATGFVRATKQGDHDFAAFGETVISVEYSARNVAMLYRTWHTRDCAWSEAIDGSVGELHINWYPSVSEINKRFPGRLHSSLTDALQKDPNRTVKCRRIVLLAEDYDTAPVGKRWPFKWVSITVDVENKYVLEEVSTRRRQFVVPRWQTVSGSQYAHSPATIIGLPDARLIQSMTLTLLEAGEMAVRPPMLAEKDIVREDVQLYAGGITWIDGDYDKRKHDVLRTLSTDKHGLPTGFDMSDRVMQQLAAVFYLNKLTLPPMEKAMTAYEVRERIKEYLRIARPLFEPAEADYNGGLCDETFDELLNRGAFGPVQDIPPQLQGRKTIYRFESPLHEAVERQDAVTFLEGKQALLEAIEIDPTARHVVDVRKALRGALKAVKFKADWMREEREVDQLALDEQEKQEAAAQVAVANEGAQAAERLGKASAAIAP